MPKIHFLLMKQILLLLLATAARSTANVALMWLGDKDSDNAKKCKTKYVVIILI